MPKVEFSRQINLGQIITACTFVFTTGAAVIGIYVGVATKIADISLHIAQQEKDIAELRVATSTVVTDHIMTGQLADIAKDLKDSNKAIVEQLVGLRVDIGILKKDAGK